MRFSARCQTLPQEKAKICSQALTNHFTPKQNREYEIHVFRQAKQENNERVSAFRTRLRQLAITCEFDDVDPDSPKL